MAFYLLQQGAVLSEGQCQAVGGLRRALYTGGDRR